MPHKRLTADQRRQLIALLGIPILSQLDAAALAMTSPSRVEAARKAGWMPSSYRIGRGPWRLHRFEVDAWTLQGCPVEVRQ